MTGLPLMRATRRGAASGVMVAIAASGCEVGTRRDDAPRQAPTTPEPAADPDAALVDEVVAEVVEVAGVVAGAARANRALAAELAPWRQLHASHLRALDAGSAPRPARARGSRAELRSLVRRREAALQRRLAAGAVAARSGALASLLATMSAAVAQRLAEGSREGR